jgi:hypothetical protein
MTMPQTLRNRKPAASNFFILFGRYKDAEISLLGYGGAAGTANDHLRG